MEVGDYVRTKQGRIGKISNLTVDYSSELILCEESSIPFAKHQIIKSSPNIIYLIKVGDYVNGLKITYIDEPDEYNPQRLLYFEYPIDYVIKTFCNEDIKSIVTKEQFEAMEYKVGE